MPTTISIDWKQESTDKLEWIIRKRMHKLKVSQAQLGDELGITQQAFSKKLQNMDFTWYQYLTIWKALDITGEEISKVAERIR